MTRIVPALTARTQLGQILARVKRGNERFVIDKRGEPQAVLISVEDYLRKFARRPAALEEIQQAAAAKRMNRLSLNAINLEIKRYRRKRVPQSRQRSRD